jgi:hypothetical protein
MIATLVACVLAGCEQGEKGTTLSAHPDGAAPVTAPVPLETPRPRGLDARLRADIDSLARAGGHGSRVVFTPGNAWAVGYLRRSFLESTPHVQCDTFLLRAGWAPLVNVIATIPGVTDSLLVICAHLDASASRDRGWQRNWSRMPAPGADDDATGTAALIEILGLVAHAGAPPHYTLIVVGTEGEEKNPSYVGHHLGSRDLAGRLRREKRAVKGVIALDMIAGNREEPYLPVFASNAGRPIARELFDLNAKLGTGLIIPDRFEPCTRSDNESFDRVGLPAILLMESPSPWKRAGRSPRNMTYHSSGDLPENLNYAMLGAVTRLVAAYAMR